MDGLLKKRLEWVERRRRVGAEFVTRRGKSRNEISGQSGQ